EFREFLTYKAERYGRTLAVVDRWYPSSKTCSVCGHLLASLSLGTRHWSCPSCGARHDRDLNAAKNIKTAGRAAGGCLWRRCQTAKVRPSATAGRNRNPRL
ncbi:MAG TPA: transposase, partial [Nakamurella sp.]